MRRQKKKIIEIIVPAKEKLKIKNIRKINNNGILIETETKEDLQNLLRNDKLENAGLIVGQPPKRRPRMAIYNIPKNMPEKDVLTAIRLQNFEHIPKSKFPEVFKLLFKTGDRAKETVNWIVEVTPEIRDEIKKQSRLFLGWNACHIQDYIAVSRCYKCQAFGHIAKFCRASQDTCGHCAKEGHS